VTDGVHDARGYADWTKSSSLAGETLRVSTKILAADDYAHPTFRRSDFLRTVIDCRRIA
jgi:hypothetical protein